MADLLITSGIDFARPSVASNGEASFVAVWIEPAASNVRAVAFRAAGLESNSFQVNTTQGGQQSLPVVARVGGPVPGFAVAWISRGRDLMLQSCDTEGNQVAREIRVNTTDVSSEHKPALAGMLGGNIAVAWTDAVPDGGIRARIFKPDGRPVGGEIRVNTSPGVHFAPIMTELDPDGFAIAWQGGPQSGISSVLVQAFDPEGTKLFREQGPRFLPSGTDMAIAFVTKEINDEIGRFVIAYTSSTGTGSNPVSTVVAALFNADGSEGHSTNVTHRADRTHAADVAVRGLPNGRIVVTWDERSTRIIGGARRDRDIKAMVLQQQGSSPSDRILIPSVGPVRVNQVREEGQFSPGVAMVLDAQNRENIGIVWNDDDPASNDSSVRALKARVLSDTLA